MTNKEDNKMIEMLQSGKDVYIYDDFEQIVVKLVPTSENTQAFIKMKGREEYEVDRSTKIVYEATLGGILVDKKFYDNF